MTAYYNEWEPYAAQWLRNLIAAGHIAPGDVDERDIRTISADELKGYTQCHFFAGIGGWSIALRLAGWPDDRPVWTGSCPCQPFSVAGKGKAQSDERHLWPVWFKLIAEARPAVVFGEQVAGAIAHGWWDDAADDLEREGYETGAAVLPACSVGAPHKRDRLWFVAQPVIDRPQGRPRQPAASGTTLAYSAQQLHDRSGNAGANGRDEHTNSGADAANTTSERLQGQGEHGIGGSKASNREGEANNAIPECIADFWRAEPAVGRVANGIPARAHKLSAYGNAIVPQVAAEFIKAAEGAIA